jgi:hypothetical protein
MITDQWNEYNGMNGQEGACEVGNGLWQGVELGGMEVAYGYHGIHVGNSIQQGHQLDCGYVIDSWQSIGGKYHLRKAAQGCRTVRPW